MPTKYYWDSCVFIDRLQRTPHRIGPLEQITNDAADGKVLIVTSTMAIAEVVRVDSQENDETQDNLIRDYFDNDCIVVHQVDRRIAEDAARICRKTGVKPPDAIHVATALMADVSVLHTYDNNLLSKNGLVGSPPLRIETPAARRVQLDMFSADSECQPSVTKSRATTHETAAIVGRRTVPIVVNSSWHIRTPGTLLRRRTLLGVF